MRIIERIDNFIKLVNWDKLQEHWNIDISNDLRGLLTINSDFHKYWMENPDQRVGQVLINLQLIPDSIQAWNDEETNILIDQGIAPEECLFWTSMMDKEGNMLDEPVNRLVKDMATSHINRILLDYSSRLAPRYIEAFNGVLHSRRDNDEQTES